MAQVLEWPAANAAAGVLRPDGTTCSTGPASRPFPLASVTKPLVSLAVLVAVEEGTLALDQPAGPPGSTVRHLLAHASGLGPDSPEVLAPPGRRRIYSNAGFEALGAALEAASGFRTADYLHEAVIAPLGLEATRLDGSPAHGATSTVDDLLRLAAEVLRPTLVAPSTMADALSEQFAGLAGVLPGFGPQDPNPWGLGFEIKGHKSPHWTGQRNAPGTAGHFGRAGTCWWVDPQWGGALAVLTDEPFGPWAAERWPRLADDVLSDT
jgi:CubicO group peptidase (beta-lactamase class C family)